MNKKGQIGIFLLIMVIMIIVVILVSFGTGLLNLGMFKFFAPKWEDAKREVWENTDSRVNGAVQTISDRYLEYNRAEDDIERDAICHNIRIAYPDLDPSKINDQRLRYFFEDCKYGI